MVSGTRFLTGCHRYDYEPQLPGASVWRFSQLLIYLRTDDAVRDGEKREMSACHEHRLYARVLQERLEDETHGGGWNEQGDCVVEICKQ